MKTILVLAMFANFNVSPDCGCYVQYYLSTAADHWQPKVAGYLIDLGDPADVTTGTFVDTKDWNTVYKDTTLKEPDTLLMTLTLGKKVSNHRYITTDCDHCRYKTVDVKNGVKNYDYLIWLNAQDTVLK